MAKKRTRPRYPKGHAKAGLFMSNRAIAARRASRKRKRTTKRKSNPGRAGGTLAKMNPKRRTTKRKTTKRKTTRRRSTTRRNPRMKKDPFTNALTTLSHGALGYLGATATRNGSRYLETHYPGTFNAVWKGTLVEFAGAALVGALAHKASKNLQNFVKAAGAGMAQAAVTRLAADQAPASFADLRGYGVGCCQNPWDRYSSGMGAITTPARGSLAAIPTRARSLSAITTPARTLAGVAAGDDYDGSF